MTIKTVICHTKLFQNHVSAFRKHTINIDGIRKSLHGVNTEGVHLILSPNLGTKLRNVFKEGVFLCVVHL